MATSIKVQKFKTCEEVVIVSTKGKEDESWNVGVWDVRTGSLLQTHRNGSASPNSLCLLGSESLLTASHTKPVIHLWNMLRQGQKHRKLICGSKVVSLSVSPDQTWMAAGMEDKINIWQVCTGELHAVLLFSSVEVSYIKFSPSGEHLVSAYKDGTVAVWELQDALIVDPLRLGDTSPVNVYNGHTGQINDIFISICNTVVTCGTDYTVRIWHLLEKEELKIFELGAAVCSVVMDQSEFTLYAGDINGNVFCFDLHHKPETNLVHIDVREGSDGFIVYPAHSAAVRCLRLTQDNSQIVSASDDMTVKIWSMMSPVHPITIPLNDTVCDLIVTPIPEALVYPDLKPRVSLSSLKRNLHSADGEVSSGDIYINITCKQMVPSSSVVAEHTENSSEAADSVKLVDPEEIATLRERANKLKRANEEIYQFAVKEIVK